MRLDFRELLAQPPLWPFVLKLRGHHFLPRHKPRRFKQSQRRALARRRKS